MANNKNKIQAIYNSLKANGDFTGTEEDFNAHFFAKGKQGYQNRLNIYNILKDGGATVGDTYEVFAKSIGLQAINTTHPSSKPASPPFPEPTKAHMQQVMGDTITPKPAVAESISAPNKVVEVSQDNRKQTQHIRQQVEQDQILKRQQEAERTKWAKLTPEQRKQQLTQMREQILQERQKALQAQEAENKDFQQDIARQQPDGRSIATLANSTFSPYQAAINKYDKQLEEINAAIENDGFWAGVWDYTSKGRNWTLGFSDLADAGAVRRAAKKAQKGQKLSQADQVLLTAVAKTQHNQEKVDQSLDNFYRFGQGAAQSAQFGLEMLATGGFGALRGAATKGAVKLLGNNIAAKTIGSTIGVAAAGAAQTITTGMPRVAANAYQREIGFVTTDQEGDFQFHNQEEAAKAFAKAFATQTIENATEVMGGELIFKTAGKALKGTGNAILKVAQQYVPVAKTLTGKTSTLFQNLANNEIAKTIKAGTQHSSRWLKRAQIHSFAPEAMEEEISALLNAAIVGDQSITDQKDPQGNIIKHGIFSQHTQKDILLGTALTLGFLHAPTIGIGTAAHLYNNHKLSTADKQAAAIIGEEKWDTIRQTLKNADNDNIEAAYQQALAQEGLNQDQQQAITEYATRLMTNRGYQMAELAQAQAKAQQEEQDPQDDIIADQNAAYATGYQHISTQQAVDRLNAAEQQLRTKLPFIPKDQDIDQFFGAEQESNYASLHSMYNQEQRQAIEEYLTAKYQYQGRVQRISDDIDQEIAATQASIQRHTQKDTGQLINVLLNDGTQGHIIAGSLEQDPQGNITGKNQMLVLLDPQGNVKATAAGNITKIISTTHAQEEKQKAQDTIRARHTNRAQIESQGLHYYQVGDTAHYNGQEVQILEEADQDGNIVIRGALGQNQTPAVIKIPATLLQQAPTPQPSELAHHPQQAPTQNTQEEQQHPVEQTSHTQPPSPETPTPSQQTEQPTTPQLTDDQIIADYQAAGLQATHQFLNDTQRSGLDQEEQQEFIQAQITQAQKTLNHLQKKKTKVSTDLVAYRAQKQQYLSDIEAAKQAIDFWTQVENQRLAQAQQQLQQQPTPLPNSTTAQQQQTIHQTNPADNSIQPIGKGTFGNIYDQFRGKPQQAINFLMSQQQGLALAALHHNKVGDIDLWWGNAKAGLMKIAQKHPEVLHSLQPILEEMTIVQESDNRIILESPTHKAIISKLLGKKKTDNWLLSAYEKKETPASSSDIETGSEELRDGTAASQSLSSTAKVDNSQQTTKQNDENKTINHTPTNPDQRIQNERDGLIYISRPNPKPINQLTEKEQAFREMVKNSLGKTYLHQEPTTGKSIQFTPQAILPHGAVVGKQVHYDAEGNVSTTIARKSYLYVMYGNSLMDGFWTQIQEQQHPQSQSNTQGNPIGQEGKLQLQAVENIDQLTDEDFLTPTRSIQLPTLPQVVDQAIGANQKNIIIKKNTLQRNKERHPEVSPQDSRDILKAALYTPTLYGQNPKHKRPANWVLINIPTPQGNSRLVLLEINEKKENVEILHWHFADERGIEKIKRQAQRENQQLLILPSVQTKEADALSSPKQDLSSDGKDTQTSPKDQTQTTKSKAKPTTNTTNTKIQDFGEKIGGARKDLAKERIQQAQGLSESDLKEIGADGILSEKEIIKAIEEERMTLKEGHILLAAYHITKTLAKDRRNNALSIYSNIAAKWANAQQLTAQQVTEEFHPLLQKSRVSYYLEKGQTIVDCYIHTYQRLDIPNKKYKRFSSTLIIPRANGDFYLFSSPTAKSGIAVRSFRLEGYIEKKYPLVEKEDKTKAATPKKENGLSVSKIKERYREKYIIKSRFVPGDITITPHRFNTKEEGEQYLEDNKEELTTREEKLARELTGRNVASRQRVGKDWLEGRDATEKDFLDIFGFRGVEFGNWVNQAERREYLNRTYNDLMDFATIIGISPKALSLGGNLALAFGSRGAAKASAHYEPLKKVINLTRSNGAGALAHEWFHALDNFLTYSVSPNSLGYASDNAKPLREELQEAFEHIKRVMNSLEYTKRSAEAGKYWSRQIEKMARAFEDYIESRLQEQGITSTLLTRENIHYTTQQLKDTAYPKLSIEERETLRPHFDHLFNTLQEREDEQGNRILYQLATQPLEGETPVAQLATDTALHLLAQAGIPVHHVTQQEAQQVLRLAQATPQHTASHTRPLQNDSDPNLAITTLSPDTLLPIPQIQGQPPSTAQVAAAIASLPQQVHTLDGHTLSVSKRTRNKLSNELSKHKDNNATLQALAKLQQVVESSILVEEHSDHAKIEGERKADSPSDRNVEKVQRFYGAVSINGETYRAKTTAVIFREGNNRIRGYEVTKIELLPATRRSQNSDVVKESNSITLANLLKDTEFSYQNGKKILDELQNNTQNPDFQLLRTPSGTIYGWAKSGHIYLTPQGLNPETPLHEYTHLWAQAMLQRNPQGWKSIINLLQDTPIWQEVEADPAYQGLLNSQDTIASEALARLSGRENGQRILEAAQQAIHQAKGTQKDKAANILHRLTQALHRFWQWVGKDLFHIHHFQSLQEITDRILYDLVSGTQLNLNTSNTEFQPTYATDTDVMDTNDRFNQQLEELTEENADSTTLSLGIPNHILQTAGVEAKEMRLYGSKVIKKMHKHNFQLKELKDLPIAVANPIAVFNNYSKNGNRSILTELSTQQGNILVTISIGKGVDIEFNIVSSVFGKNNNSIIRWINNGYATYIDKEKALNYLHLSAPIAEASNNQELSSAAKIIQNFENPKLNEQNNFNDTQNQPSIPKFYSKEAKTKAAQQLAQQLGEPLLILHSNNITDPAPATQERKRNAKGWYDPTTRQVIVVLDNNTDAQDIRATILHETIGHKGLQALIGKPRFRNFIASIFANASQHLRNDILDLARKRGWDIQEATSEYIAQMAERGFQQRDSLNLWASVKQAFLDAFSAMKVAIGWHITHREIAYLLWKSYQHTQTQQYGAIHTAAIHTAAIHLMQARLGLDHSGRSPRHPNTDSKGVPFATTTDGSIDFGQITQDTGLTPAPIRLSQGNANYGLLHIQQKHSEELKEAGFLSVEDFVATVAQNFNTIRKGKDYGHKQSYLLEFTDQKNNTLFIELSKDGEYWMVNSAGRFRKNYSKNKEVVWSLPAVENETPIHFEKVSPEASNDRTDNEMSGNSSQTTSSTAKVDNSHQTTKPNPENSIEYRDEEETLQTQTLSHLADFMAERVATTAFQAREAVQDSMLALRDFMLETLRQEGAETKSIKEVDDFENAYIAENTLSSSVKAKWDNYETTILRPLLQAVHQLCDTSREAREQLNRYMLAKHGIERQAYMAAREAQKQAISKVGTRQAYEAAMMISPTSQSYEEAFEQAYQAALAKTQARDYAGLTGLTIHPQEDSVEIAEAIVRAETIIAEYEIQNDPSFIQQLWQRIGAANTHTLEELRAAGVISTERKQEIESMYQYYIPLRGFADGTSRDQYAYVSESPARRGSILKRAKGRTSLADDPIATMAEMAERGFTEAARNKMKQRFLNFIENHPTDYVGTNDLYLQLNESTGEWEAIRYPEPNPSETQAQYAQRLAEIQANLQAQALKNPNITRADQLFTQPYRLLPQDLGEHQILVKRAGRDIIITIYGTPRVAQAINGLTNPDVPTKGSISQITNFFRTLMRWQSQLYTSFSPNFLTRNFSRDFLYASSLLSVKEGADYALRFQKKKMLVKDVVDVVQLLYRWENGTLDLNNPKEREFHNFILGGGETGYIANNQLEWHKKNVTKLIKNLGHRNLAKSAFKGYERLNRAIECGTRFCVYLTSRELGRSIERSVFDAKEATVNFNKKGAGAKMAGQEGQTFLGSTIALISDFFKTTMLFYNPSVQGQTNLLREAKAHPLRFTALISSLTILGIAQAYFGDLLGDEEEEKKYGYINTHKRRTNILFPVVDGLHVGPAIPQGFTAFFGMGELIGSCITGNGAPRTTADAIWQAAQLLASISPVNPIEGMDEFNFMQAIANTFTPDIIQHEVDIANNDTWYGTPIYRDTDYNKEDPEWEKAFRQEGLMWQVAKTLEQATRQPNQAKGWLNINPSTWDYRLRGYGGGISGTISDLLNTIETGNFSEAPILKAISIRSDADHALRAIRSDYHKMRKYSQWLTEEYKKAADDTYKAQYVMEYGQQEGYELTPQQAPQQYEQSSQRVAQLDATGKLPKAVQTLEIEKQLKELRQKRKALTDAAQLDSLQKTEFHLTQQALSLWY